MAPFTPVLINPPRQPTAAERTLYTSHFPKIGNFLILAEASPKYNCMGWVLRMEQDLSDNDYWTQQVLNGNCEFLPPPQLIM
jgi:hypothetical protein